VVIISHMKEFVNDILSDVKEIFAAIGIPFVM
jgi:hypothetical protein